MIANFRIKTTFKYIIVVMFLFLYKCGYSREIKVGYVDFNDFVVYEKNGDRTGYAGEIFNNLEKLSNTDYRLINDTWAELERKLKSKELDIILVGRKDEKRLNEYSYSNFDLGVSKGIIYALPNSDYYYNDFSKLNNKKVGYYCPSLIKDFKRYSLKNKINYEEKQYFNKAKMLEGLKNHEVDLIAVEYMRYDNSLKKVGEFSTKPLFAMSLKGSKAMDIFNENYKNLFMERYDIRSYLYEKYYKSKVNNKFLLTRPEAEYLKNLGEITVAVKDIKPLNWKDEVTGKPVGAYINALKEIGKRLNLKVNFVLVNKDMSRDEILEKYDYFLDSVEKISNKEKNSFDPDSICRINYIYIKDRNNKIDFLRNLNIGVLNKDREISEKIKNRDKKYNFYFYEDAGKMADAVANGSIDKALINEIRVPYLFKDLKYSNLTMIYLEEIYGDLKLMSKDDNFLLQSSINKVVNYLGRDKIYKIALSNLDINDNKSVFKNFFTLYGLKVIIMILSLVSTILIMYVLQRNKIYKKLARAKSEAEYANKAKLNFLSNMSHDMKTPMNSIIGMTNLGLEECKKNNCNSYFEHIRESSYYLLSLLNDILDLQDIENDNMDLELDNERLENIIEEVEKIINFKINEKAIDFKIKRDRNNYYINIDKKRLEQILINILNNSIKYTNFKGEILWENTLKLEGETKGYYTFKIKDNGMGISEEFQKNMMYKSFTRGKNKFSNNNEGVGLGLSITKKLVEKMNGTINCISKINKGTEFIVTIPCTILTEEQFLQLEKNKGIDEEMSLKNKKILICDDIQINRIILRKISHSLGLVVEEAKNGKIAVEMIRKNNYDAVLMDIRMPVMDGLEAAKKIREFNEEIVIIAVSANDYEEDIKKSLKVGMNGHLGKPIEKSELESILKKNLK